MKAISPTIVRIGIRSVFGRRRGILLFVLPLVLIGLAVPVRLLADASVRGARLRSEGGIEVEASDFGRFSEVLPRLAREHAVRLHEVTPADESLESVFSYLVSS